MNNNQSTVLLTEVKVNVPKQLNLNLHYINTVMLLLTEQAPEMFAANHSLISEINIEPIRWAAAIMRILIKAQRAQKQHCVCVELGAGVIVTLCRSLGR